MSLHFMTIEEDYMREFALPKGKVPDDECISIQVGGVCPKSLDLVCLLFFDGGFFTRDTNTLGETIGINEPFAS